MVVSEAALKAHGLTPLARIHNLTVTGGDPVVMLEEPLFATDRALQRAGMRIDDIDLIPAAIRRSSTSMAGRSLSAIRSARRARS
ncbi:hypothetical protein WR25_24283 [Diploscapter pachys]|uniref:Thiolase C-terminal domain-containing protein n=1 Tax=Diploscapter pachys TaxID=2018661 RepID=A0A2A2M5W7_9BILA|nr:hypothetical protein WR25_24283 [Diploscapter pachys]